MALIVQKDEKRDAHGVKCAMKTFRIKDAINLGGFQVEAEQKM